jgi:transcriptional regulator with XRE-family HTH domain
MVDVDASKRGNEGLKRLREKAGLNRSKMAKACGVTPRMWQLYENEGRLPERVEVLLCIVALTGESVSSVVSEIGYEIPSRDKLLVQTQSA